MNPTRGTVLFGREAISFKLFFVDRKTMEIAVHPDKTVIVKAPMGANYATVEQKVRKRAGWIKRQLDFFRQFDPRTPVRNYVGGETHLYLGRRYRLKISQGQLNEVKLVQGFFRISVDCKGGRPVVPAMVKRLLDAWYAEKASLRFQESFDRCWPWFERISQRKPRIQIRRMKKRWGSLSKNELLTLNADLIRAPKECIDYVITHELCHLHYHDHGSNFYRLLEKVMPGWEKRKAILELVMV
jgi:predicted metal-dependent hydrolase